MLATALPSDAPISGIRATNSSPPMRATIVFATQATQQARGDRLQQLVADAVSE